MYGEQLRVAPPRSTNKEETMRFWSDLWPRFSLPTKECGEGWSRRGDALPWESVGWSRVRP